MSDRKPQILVVDDSAYSRRALKQMIEEILPGAKVLYASAGDEGLQLAFKVEPEIIFLDLEMPRMDGFTFLRLLMAKNPTPVIVVSGQNDEHNVLKALELGALDFISKPTQTASTRIYEIRDEIKEKLALVEIAHLKASRQSHAPAFATPPPPAKALPDFHTEPTQLICIGASTGGPGTISRILDRIKLEPWTSIAIGQHMPEGFTKAFAERLNKMYAFPVQEVRHLERLNAGTVYICPGGQNARIIRARELRWELSPAEPDDRYIPSINKLFDSAAESFGSQCSAVILTGMGNDGTLGADKIRKAGGVVISENPETAIVFGMPRSAIDAGTTHFVHDADVIAGAVRQWMLGVLGPPNV